MTPHMTPRMTSQTTPHMTQQPLHTIAPTPLFSPSGRQHFRRRFLQQKQPAKHPLSDLIMQALLDHISLVTHPFHKILVVGYPGAQNIVQLQESLSSAFTLLDIAQPLDYSLSFVAAEMEAMPFAPNSFDLIINVMTLHLCNDIPGLLKQMNLCLQPDGLLVSACVGAATLRHFQHDWITNEYRITGGVNPRFLPMIAASNAATLMQRAGFKVNVCQSTKYVLEFATVSNFIEAIRHFGQWAPLTTWQRGLGRPRSFRKIVDAWTASVQVDVNILYLSGRAPAAAQQKPCLPGMQRLRLNPPAGQTK